MRNTDTSLLGAQDALNRRTFLGGAGAGVLALAGLLDATPAGAAARAKVKRIIYLFQSGAPSQMELFDPKPGLVRLMGSELPDSVRKGQRLTGMTAGQGNFPVAPSAIGFGRHGKSGMEIADILPHTASIADKICLIRSMHTDAINHDPAVTFFQTGSQLAGRPSIGSWLSYGLGTQNKDLPAFLVLTSKGSGRPDDQPLYDRLWGAGFLPTVHQGVKLRNAGDPVLYLSDPPGLGRGDRRAMLDDLRGLNRLRRAVTADPETDTRIAQYEMAFRMQASVPALADIGKEPKHVLDLYGPDVHRPGSFAHNCLLARRLSEQGVRFVQCFHMGWDHHGDLPKAITLQARDTDQPSAALVKDLEQRGLLDETLVVWGGEFGRTVYSQGGLNKDNYGRDHHPRCFSLWLCGAGIRGGMTWGSTDDFSYNIASDPVSVHDLHATMLHLMGIDHTRLTYRYQGRDYRLTDVFGDIVRPILA